ncbi:MAG TPA: sigma factor [Myxococcota bacterium]
MRKPSLGDLEPQLEALHPASFAWATRCCGGNPEEAEDVLQATCLKLLDGKARYRGRSSLETWLFSVIRTTAAAAARRSDGALGRNGSKMLLDRDHGSGRCGAAGFAAFCR